MGKKNGDYSNNNSENNKIMKKNKFDFNKKKENTIKSISEVELFLRNFKNISKYIKLYKIIK
ncbi:MAG: hypothetical protein IJ890_06615 [Clostridia bacterium]|nr:hypothetical protein [Clostridia bacterium]